MRENRLNRNPQANGNLKDVLPLSFFFCLHMLPNVSPYFQVHLTFPPPPPPPRLHDIPVMYFWFFMSFAEWFYCKCRTWSGTWVCELYGAKPLFRKHCKAVCFQFPLQCQCYIFSQQWFAAIFQWLLLNTVSCTKLIYVLMNSLP